MVWPLALILLLRWAPDWLRIALVATGATLCYFSAAILVDPSNTDRVYQGTDTRSGAILLGALAAMTIGSRLTAWAAQWWAGAVAILALAVLWVIADGSTLTFYAWQLPAAGIAGSVLLLHLATGDALLARVFAWRPFVAIGALSYGLYLWHWPIWVFLTSTPFVTESALRVGLAFTASFVLAAGSYFFVERPVRRKTLRARPFLGAIAVVMVAIALSAMLFQPEPPAEQTVGILVTH